MASHGDAPKGRRIGPSLLAELGDGEMTLNELSERTGEDREAVRFSVRLLVRKGLVDAIRPERLGRGRAVKYRRARS